MKAHGTGIIGRRTLKPEMRGVCSVQGNGQHFYQIKCNRLAKGKKEF